MRLGKKDKIVFEEGKRHRRFEEEKGFLPPPFLLLAEIGRLQDTCYRFKVPETEGVSYTRRNVLRALDLHGELLQSELAVRGHISAASVSVELSAMEREGLIQRERIETDSRKSMVSLTPLGKEKQKKIREGEMSLAAVIEKGLSKEEKEILSRMLVNVRNNLVDLFEDIEVKR